MDGWHSINGVPWLCVEPNADPSHEGSADRQCEAGVVLAHGYVHETPAEAGIGARAAAALVRELSRPRETADFGVVELSVGARVNLQDTAIRIIGTAAAVRSGLAALDRLLRDPTDLDLDRPASSPTFFWDGWSDELTAWFGMGTVALVAEEMISWSGESERLRAMVAGLHPSRGSRTVAWTSEPSLIGSAFAERADSPTTAPADSPTTTSADALADRTAQPFRWRDPDPVADGPASVAGHVFNNLFTLRVPANRANDLALRLLTRTVRRSLVELTRLAGALDLTIEQVGADLLFAVRAVPGQQRYQPSRTRRALDEALAVYDASTDAALAEELRRAQQADALAGDLAPFARALDAHRSGTHPTWTDIVESFQRLTTDDLRRAITQVRRSMLFGVPSDDPNAPPPPLWQPPPVPEPQRPWLQRGSKFPITTAGAPNNRSRLRVTDQVVQILTRPGRFRGALQFAPIRAAMNLSALALRVDHAEGYTTLVDTDNRRVTITWPAFWRTAAVRAKIDRATPDGLRITTPLSAEQSAALHQRVIRGRIGIGVAVIVAVGFVLLFIFAPVTGQNRADAQQPTVRTVPAGQQVSLANQTTIVVSDPRWSAYQNGSRQLLSLTVRACGGGATVDPNADSETRNRIGVDQFQLIGITPASRPATAIGVRPGPLLTTQLVQGQCTTGSISFSVDATAPVGGGRIQFVNGAGDDLSWTLS